MNKEFIPYEQALELKELGFDEECLGLYNKNGDVLPLKPYTSENKAPLYQQAFRWFREKYCLQHEIIRAGSKHWLLTIIEIDKVTENSIFNGNRYELDDEIEPNTYEEAELACLKKLIEIVKQSKK